MRESTFGQADYIADYNENCYSKIRYHSTVPILPCFNGLLQVRTWVRTSKLTAANKAAKAR